MEPLHVSFVSLETLQNVLSLRNGTEAQFLARQKVGKTYGCITGIGNQNTATKEFLQSICVWGYSQENNANPRLKVIKDEIYFVVGPQTSREDLVRVLNLYGRTKENKDSIRSSASFAKLTKDKRKQMYGWRIIDMLTRSEVEEGIQAFLDNYPERKQTYCLILV